MTREYLANYMYLDQLIKSNEKKLKYYQEKELKTEHSIVRGSMNQFPYTPKNFVVSGYNIQQEEERMNKIRELALKLSKHKQQLEDMKLEIEEFILDIENLPVKLIFTYYYIDGMTEEEIGMKMGYDRSTIGKKINKYLKEHSHKSQS